LAGNRTKPRGRQLYLVPTDGGVLSGDPCVVGQIPGVALQNKDAANGVTVDTLGVYSLSVKGVGLAAANVAVAVGDIIYYVPGTTPKLSKSSDGVGAVRYGYALGIVSSGATANIDVRLGY
jgi:predicted RecA/RadA family phage recombinase